LSTIIHYSSFDPIIFISRKVTRSRTVSQIQGMPDGEYFQVQFEVKFANQTGMERMTVAKESGSWKVAGYMMR
jgi:hypothetical protein